VFIGGQQWLAVFRHLQSNAFLIRKPAIIWCDSVGQVFNLVSNLASFSPAVKFGRLQTCPRNLGKVVVRSYFFGGASFHRLVPLPTSIPRSKNRRYLSAALAGSVCTAASMTDPETP
jgi:hypothetical protein